MTCRRPPRVTSSSFLALGARHPPTRHLQDCLQGKCPDFFDQVLMMLAVAYGGAERRCGGGIGVV